jgi:hypothetical protein
MWRWVQTVNWVVSLAILAVAAWWIWRRFRSPEEWGYGEPGCPKCRYVVLGLTGTICPECGNDLEQSGIVRLGRSRWLRRIGGSLAWTFIALIGWGAVVVLLDAVGLVQFVMVHELSNTQTFKVETGAGDGLLEVRVEGLGFGDDPAVDRVTALRVGSGARLLMWSKSKSVSQPEIIAWLRGQGFTPARAEAVGKELAQVAEASAALEAVRDFSIRGRRITADNVHEAWIGGARVKELTPVGSWSQRRGNWLFDTVPWAGVAVGVAWIFGLRGMWPSGRRREPYFPVDAPFAGSRAPDFR